MAVAQLPLGCVPLKLLPRVSSLRFPPRPTFSQSAKDVVASGRAVALFQIISCTLFLSVSVLLPFFVSSFLRSFHPPHPAPPVVAIISASPDQLYPVAQIGYVNLTHAYKYIDGLLYKYYMSTFSAFEKKTPLNPFSVLDFILKAYSRGFQR